MIMARTVVSRTMLDITESIGLIIRDVTSSCPLFGHIDSDRLLVCLSTNRRGNNGGTYGKLVPLRFKDGEKVTRYGKHHYSIPEVYNAGIECLYILYFYMPRFFDLPPEEKIKVIFHELYHISPLFNGDIRRLGAKKAAHGHSKKHYDERYKSELQHYISFVESSPQHAFLSHDSQSLFRHYDSITARRMRCPRPVRLD